MSQAEYKQPFPLNEPEEEGQARESEDDTGACIVVSGSPGDGFSFVGPFQDMDTAIEWASVHIKDESWWVSGLETPDLGELEGGE